MSCKRIGIMGRGVQNHSRPGSPREKRHLMNVQSMIFSLNPSLCKAIFHVFSPFTCTCTTWIALRFKQMLAAKIRERQAWAAEKEKKEKEENKKRSEDEKEKKKKDMEDKKKDAYKKKDEERQRKKSLPAARSRKS